MCCGQFQINPSDFVKANYYEVDGVLTTKLDQVNVSTTTTRNLPRCPDETAVAGKGNVHYLKHGAFCLETQKFPDAVHHVRRILSFLKIISSILYSRKTSHRQLSIPEMFTNMKSSSSLDGMHKLLLLIQTGFRVN